MERSWVGSRQGGTRSGKMRERDEERKVSGRRKGRMELGQASSSKGGGEDESRGLWCWGGEGQ